MKLIPVKYEIEGRSAYIESRGQSGWAIVNDCEQVLNKFGEWVYEPMPSNRTEEFIKQTRFESAEKALEVFEKFY